MSNLLSCLTALSGRQSVLLSLVLLDLGPGIHDTRNETNEDSRDTSNGDGGSEEDETRNSDGQLVESTDHGVGGGGGDSDAPGGAVRDEDGSQTGVDDADKDAVSRVLGEVLGEVDAGPVLGDKGEEDKDGNVHLVDDLAHAQNIRGRTEDVHGHPEVTGVQGSKRIGIASGGTVVTRNSALDISPSSNHGAQDHKTERSESGRGDGTAEPENLAVCNGNNGQVLEDGVDRHRKELQSLGACVDHTNEDERNGGVVLLLAIANVVLVGDFRHLGHEVVVLLVLVGHGCEGASVGRSVASDEVLLKEWTNGRLSFNLD
ncbi:hypothetical protein HG530_006102 [Fusarium avenaceum]|nr:hypothetical protein HG530_006102 [Fusarium avenaceum]